MGSMRIPEGRCGSSEGEGYKQAMTLASGHTRTDRQGVYIYMDAVPSAHGPINTQRSHSLMGEFGQTTRVGRPYYPHYPAPTERMESFGRCRERRDDFRETRGE